MAKDKNVRKMTFRQPKKDQEEMNPALARANFLYEHVALALMTAFACLGGIIWMVAVATDYWLISISSSIQYLIRNKNPLAVNGSDIFLWSYSGLWRKCDIFYHSSLNNTPPLDNVTVSDITNHLILCEFHPISKSEDNKQSSNNSTDDTGTHPADFIRAQMSVVVLVVVIMTLALGFSVYALRYPRYMYKRVAAALHAFTAITLFIIIELVKSGEHPGYIDKRNENLDKFYNENQVLVQNYHGYSFLLAWTALLVFVSTAMSFVCMSGKRKNLLEDSAVVLK